VQKIVIDTNEFIFSILSAKSYSAEIMKMVFSESIEFYVSDDILSEYERVLAYDKFGLSIERRKQILDDIRAIGKFVIPVPSMLQIRDEDDRVFYDTAKQAGAIVITSDKDLLVLNEKFIMTAEDYIKDYRYQ